MPLSATASIDGRSWPGITHRYAASPPRSNFVAYQRRLDSLAFQNLYFGGFCGLEYLGLNMAITDVSEAVAHAPGLARSRELLLVFSLRPATTCYWHRQTFPNLTTILVATTVIAQQRDRPN